MSPFASWLIVGAAFATVWTIWRGLDLLFRRLWP